MMLGKSQGVPGEDEEREQAQRLVDSQDSEHLTVVRHAHSTVQTFTAAFSFPAIAGRMQRGPHFGRVRQAMPSRKGEMMHALRASNVAQPWANVHLRRTRTMK